MASVVWHRRRTGIWRFSTHDAALVVLAALHAVILAVWPLTPLIAVGVWWNSNTIAHNFIRRPFFQSAGMNRLFSAALSVLLGIPQTLWRDRHLAHHAGVEWRFRVSRRLVAETALVVCLWAALASLRPLHQSCSELELRPGFGILFVSPFNEWESCSHLTLARVSSAQAPLVPKGHRGSQ